MKTTTRAALFLALASVASAADVVSTEINGPANGNRSGLHTVAVKFSEPVTSTNTALQLTNITTDTPVDTSAAVLSGSGTDLLTWQFSGVPLSDGQYTATLQTGGVSPSLDVKSTILFHVLLGDTDGDLRVNFDDTVPLSLYFGESGDPYRPGDGTGDGLVNFDDTIPLSLNFGADVLPCPPPPPMPFFRRR
jgi:hypothetical protein